MSTFRDLVEWLSHHDLSEITIPLKRRGITSVDELRAQNECMNTCGLTPTDTARLKVARRNLSTDIVTPTTDTRVIYQGRSDAPTDAALPQNRSHSIASLENDMHAQSSLAPRDSKWATWQTLAHAWGHAPVPLTRILIRDISASLKAGGYRSTSTYISRAREEHVAMTGESVPTDVELMIRKCMASTNRGIGPGDLKDGFQVELLRSSILCQHTDSYTARDFLTTDCSAQTDMVLCGCWWLTRGLEMATTKAHHMWAELTTAFWTLPVQKNDTSGSCVTRPHKCCCMKHIV